MRLSLALLWIATVCVAVWLYFKNEEKIRDRQYTRFHNEVLRDLNAADTPGGMIPTKTIAIVFVVLYVMLLINISNNEMNAQKRILLNDLLRLNIPLSIFAGIADLSENLLAFYHITGDEILQLVKYGLIGWVIAVFVISIAVRGVNEFFIIK